MTAKLDAHVKHSREIARYKQLLAEEKAKVKANQRELDQYRSSYNLALATSKFRPRKLKVPKLRDPKGNATAILLYSDWHLDERVDGFSVQNKNRFNKRIAAQRIEILAEKSVQQLEWCRKRYPVNKLVVWLGGDFMTGCIHQENAFNITMGPSEAVVFAGEMISSTLSVLEKIPFIKSNRIYCSLGNHGRTSDKMFFAAAYQHSYEYILYSHLAQLHKRWDWTINPAYHGYFKAEKLIVRYSHGHRVPSGGGVGGVAVPLLRAIGKDLNTTYFDLDLTGHHHQDLSIGPAEKNSSVIGWNAYAEENHCSFEEPNQKLLVIDGSRKVYSGQIFCE